MSMKSYKLIEPFYLTLVLGIFIFTVHDMKKPDGLEAQTCVPAYGTIVRAGGGSGNGTSTASCPGGTTVVGGGCNCATSDAQITDSAPAGNGWNCQCEDTESDADRTSTASVICIGP